MPSSTPCSPRPATRTSFHNRNCDALSLLATVLSPFRSRSAVRRQTLNTVPLLFSSLSPSRRRIFFGMHPRHKLVWLLSATSWSLSKCGYLPLHGTLPETSDCVSAKTQRRRPDDVHVFDVIPDHLWTQGLRDAFKEMRIDPERALWRLDRLLDGLSIAGRL